MNVKEVLAKSVLVKSALPDADYVVNPYTGCQFGCLYCYASFMGRFAGEAVADWGEYLHAKINSAELFVKEVRKLARQESPPSIFLSSVTDPYQGPEKKYRLTRRILEALVDIQYKGLVGILTKSPLVTRDIDLFKALKNVEIGLTLTSTDDRISRFLEVRAPSATSRFRALKQLNDQGLRTYAFLGPLLPHFVHYESELEDLIAKTAETGVKSVYVEHLNLKPQVMARLIPKLNESTSFEKAVYLGAKGKEHRQRLEILVTELLRKYDLRVRLNEVILHKA